MSKIFVVKGTQGYYPSEEDHLFLATTDITKAQSLVDDFGKLNELYDSFHYQDRLFLAGWDESNSEPTPPPNLKEKGPEFDALVQAHRNHNANRDEALLAFQKENRKIPSELEEAAKLYSFSRCDGSRWEFSILEVPLVENSR